MNTHFSFEDGAVITRLRKRGLLAQQQPTLRFRIITASLITWLPLFILTALDGMAWGHKVEIPFLLDWVQHSRFLIALPIAIWAESYITPRFQGVLKRFLKGEIITGEEIPRFEEAVESAQSWVDSVTAEFLLLILTYLYMSFRLEMTLPRELTSWNHLRSTISGTKTLAEHWYLWISMPLFLFVWVRWIWRQLAWAVLLFRISRLKLNLLASHPDSAGGLAFIAAGQRRFAVLVFAVSSIGCASIGEEIIFGGAKLRSFELELTAFFVVCVIIVMGPLMVFTPRLLQAKMRDWGPYGIFAARYSREFDEKWIQSKESKSETLLGTPDIQSLSDLRNSYEGISTMRTILPDRKTLIVLLIAYLIPVSPLLTTVIPLRQILSELFKLLSG